MKKLLLAFFLITSLSIIAQDDYEVDYNSTTIDSSQIDIQGDYQKPRKTAAQRMREYRRKLEIKNEILVKIQIENLRKKQELELRRKLNAGFAEAIRKIDQKRESYN